MRTRANPSVETVMGTGTASEGSANRTVMLLGRPVVRPLRVNLENAICPRSSRSVGRLSGAAREDSRESRGACRSVFVGCQQGFNKQLMAEITVQPRSSEKLSFKNNDLILPSPQPAE